LGFEKIKNFIFLLRPKHWVKNTFVLLPLFFSNSFYDVNLIYHSLLAFVIFSLTASSVYIVNDLIDIRKDSSHPVKKFRPIASGRILLHEAILLLSTLLIITIFLSFQHLDLFLVVVIYFLMNLVYSFALKNYAVVDIFTIAFGFVLRVYLGIIAINVDISSWILITTFCLALFLASIKRKQELIRNYNQTRVSLEKYSVQLIDFYINISGISAIIFYSIFAIAIKDQFFITIPIVIFAFFRYLYLSEIIKKGESPTDILFEDRLFIIIMLTWIIVCFYLI
jgi:decaprenyl-phosphate phosphoribosyltransferase